jgi:16S rRNA (guanine966-N2)-methyltransferase
MRGLRLAEVGVGDAAAHLRPTTDRVRESLFNLLVNGAHAVDFEGARVLDLFAGTGALGLEALSRGAARATFVDSGRAAARLIAANIARCRAENETALLVRDATRLGQNPGAAFDLVFLDPPYGSPLGARALSAAMAGGWVAPGATLAWEDSAPPAAPAGLATLDQRRYGNSVITLLKRDGDG